MQAVNLLRDLASTKAALIETIDGSQHRLLFGHLFEKLSRFATSLVLNVAIAIGRRSADGVAAGCPVEFASGKAIFDGCVFDLGDC